MDSSIIKTEKAFSLLEKSIRLSRDSKKRYYIFAFAVIPIFYSTIIFCISMIMLIFNQLSIYPIYFQSIFILPCITSAIFAYRFSFFFI